MQLTINSSYQQTQLNFAQATYSQTAGSGSSAAQPTCCRDRIQISDEARRPRQHGHEVEQLHHGHHGRHHGRQDELLTSILGTVTGGQVSNLQSLPAAGQAASGQTGLQTQQSGLSIQQESLAVQASSLTINGTITTADGATLSFGLDLQLLHATASSSLLAVTSGQEGNNFSYSGSAAELNSSSFSFSLSADLPDGSTGSGDGIGTFSLKDELKDLRKLMQPLVKEFLEDNGTATDRSGVNRFLSAMA